MGLESMVATELGYFYFNEHPEVERFALNQEGRFPCHLYGLRVGTCVYFFGLKPFVRSLA
jgi:hypothetical protein